MKRAVVAAALLIVAIAAGAQDLQNGRMKKLPGMQLPGMVTREDNGIPHVFAFTTHDAWFLNGWLHAQDRLFQMDTSRRTAEGTLAELLGSAALPTDVQLRTLGLGRAAAASLPVASADAKAALDAYTAGVNAYIASHPALPPEYGLLNISQVAPWTNVDSLAVGKLIAFGLSFDSDIGNTTALLTYQGIGKVVGFNGQALFSDTWRLAPFTPAATIPDATGTGSTLPLRVNGSESMTEFDTSWLKPETLELAQRYEAQMREVPLLASALDPEKHAGSNEWAVAPKNSTTGNSLIANDPHLSLVTPPNFYPISIRVPGRLNVAGMGFPGAPFVIQGQNERIAWGSTVHPMDVTDWYQEQLVPDPTSPSGVSSLYKGTKEAVIPIPQTFKFNTMGSQGVVAAPPVGGVPSATLIIPRHGPIVSYDPATGIAISVQYVGFYPTHELEAFMLADQAKNMDEFKAALQFFDFGSQNFAYADVDGNIAYFTSGELPIREDLQAGTVNGVPPYFIRNGQGGNEWMAVAHPQPNQALPYEILPYSEMPQVANPANGFFVNANNDPTGGSLDNNPLNTLRAGGGILYLNPAYDGYRAGRITQLIRQKLANGGKISPDDMKQIQGDSALIDAEVFVPYIVQAAKNAQAIGANPQLAALGALVSDPVSRLAKWDFTTPTGLADGYDAHWVKAPGAQPSQQQIDNSVAATIYSAWRSRFLANTIDAVIGAMKAPLPPAAQELSALRFQLDNFATTNGKGATSGINFFNGPASEPAANRDIIILKSLADAIAMLQSDAFAPAFNKSANLSDYRWGKLHRVVFAHIMGNALFSPGALYGLPPLPTVPGLPGVSRQGGFETVDAATHDPRASTVNGFMFGSGPNRRYVGDMAKSGVNGQSALPGGVSGDPNSPWHVNLLMLWLTNDTFPVKPDSGPAVPFLP